MATMASLANAQNKPFQGKFFTSRLSAGRLSAGKLLATPLCAGLVLIGAFAATPTTSFHPTDQLHVVASADAPSQDRTTEKPETTGPGPMQVKGPLKTPLRGPGPMQV